MNATLQAIKSAKATQRDSFMSVVVVKNSKVKQETLYTRHNKYQNIDSNHTHTHTHINATAPQPQRNVLKYFAIFKNVAQSLEPGETPSDSASHQAPNYVQR